MGLEPTKTKHGAEQVVNKYVAKFKDHCQEFASWLLCLLPRNVKLYRQMRRRHWVLKGKYY